ncbi:hypothetical protein SY88_12155 [Clostridiales bacterium PH28_bin88]|nr:hypothetical protein SY88_12155 [Clostridiales bacterium PH28_bin88]
MELTVDNKEQKLKRINEEWNKLIKGQEVDKSIVPAMVYESWKRCVEYGVDPYTPVNELIPSEEDIKELTSYQNLLSEYGIIIEVISEIAREVGLICRIADKYARTLKVIASPDVLRGHFRAGNFFAINASENIVGTNALFLSIKENKPVQLLGPEHYNYYFHAINCSAAPIHDEKGEVIGVINVSSNCYNKTSIQTLGLVIAMAKVLDNHLHINKMIEKLTVHNATMYKIMEYLSSGVVYFDEKKEIQGYNRRILDLLKINGNAKEDAIKALIFKYIMELGLLEKETETINQEMLLTINDKIESFLVSNRKIFIGSQELKGNIVLLENMESFLKLHGSLRSNNAIYTFDNILGQDAQLLFAKQMTKRIAQSTSAVIIYGESGTGKELFAQAIHNASPRIDKPFVAINCGAIPSELIESEMFGYEAGAFTGALKGGKPGKLEIASGGTLFLDEIENMPLNLQIKLLRALSTKRITKVGGMKEIPIDIRLISATKKDLMKEVEKGNFREDLYYRINIFTVELPPLRERKKDIPELVDYFIRTSAPHHKIQIDDEFFQALMVYNWRGNVRELRNIIERALVVLGDDNKLTVRHLPDHIADAFFKSRVEHRIETAKNMSCSSESKGMLKLAEEVAIEMTLQEQAGNLTRTAEKLGIARSTLYQKIKSSKRLQHVLKSYE